MEDNFKKNNTHKLLKQVSELEGKRYRYICAMKDSHGNLKTKKQDVLHIWKTHFEKHLNTQFKHDENALQELDSVDIHNENIPPITEQEVKYSIKQLANRNSHGVNF